MLLYLVLDKFHLTKLLFPAILLCLLLAVVFGYVEDKVGLARAEYEIQCERMGLKK